MNDWHTTLETLLQTSLSLGASKADALWFNTVDVSLSCRKGALEGLERSESRAVTLRVFVGDSQAIVSSTDISPASLKNLAESAVSMARATPPDPLSRLADATLYPSAAPDLELCEASEPTIEWLFTQAQEAETQALAVAGVTNSEGADAGYSRSMIGLAIAYDGAVRFANHYEASHSSLSASVLAGHGVDMQRDYDFSTARHRGDLKTAKQIGESAGKRAVARLHPKKIASATLPVIYDRRVSRQLVSALSSALNGQNIVRGSSFLRGAMGERIFAPGIRIVDDPRRIRGLASKPFDSEGVATKRLLPVDDGMLTSWLLDVRSAAALGLATTGHASRGMGSPPSPSSTNLYLEAGRETPQALIGGIKRGLLITETFGGGTNIVTGDYSQGASGFLIENGEVTSAVAEITLAGHLRDMFARLVPANDLMFDYSTNAPSLLVDGMAIAGT